MLSRAATAGFWNPPNQKTVSAIGAALCAHWAAAKAKAQFWTKQPENWLDVPRHHLNRVTTSR